MKQLKGAKSYLSRYGHGRHVKKLLSVVFAYQLRPRKP